MERRTRFSKQLFQQAHASELHSSNFRGCHPCICHSTKLEFIVQVTGYPSINIRALAMCMGPDYAFRFSEIGIIILLSWEAHGRTIARPSSVRGSDTTAPARAQSRLAPAPPRRRNHRGFLLCARIHRGSKSARLQDLRSRPEHTRCGSLRESVLARVRNGSSPALGFD